MKGREPGPPRIWLLARRGKLEISRMAVVPERRTLASAPRVSSAVGPSQPPPLPPVALPSSVLSSSCFPGGVALVLSPCWCCPRKGNGHLYRCSLGFNETMPPRYKISLS